MDTLVLPEQSSGEPTIETPEPLVIDSAEADEVLSLDFDLGLPEVGAPVNTESVSFVDTIVSGEVGDALDFDLGTDTLGGKQAESQTSPMVGDLSVSDDLSLGGIDFDLNTPDTQMQPEPFDATPDFSPEGTLVMPSVMDDAVATFIGFDEAPDTTSSSQEPLGEPELAVDFDLDFSSSAAQTVLSGVGDFSQNDILAQEIPSEDSPEYDNPKLADTVVNAAVLDDDSLDFDVKLTDSVFLGQPMTPPEFDIGSINLDLAAEPIVNSPVVESVPVADSSAPVVAEAPVDSAHWEEVNTKLDLAKAYEEMGDLEGARELLEEVVGEGPVDLVEQARAILARIGE